MGGCAYIRWESRTQLLSNLEGSFSLQSTTTVGGRVARCGADTGNTLAPSASVAQLCVDTESLGTYRRAPR